MVTKNILVKADGKDLSTIGGRLAKERDLKGWSQTVCGQLGGVTKQTQIKYELNQSSPDSDYLSRLHGHGVDVMFVLTGVRDQSAMSNEHQNLIDAYNDASDYLKRAAFAVLISPYSSDAKNAQTTPGWYRHELMGEEDVRYPQHVKAERATDTSAPAAADESRAPRPGLPGEKAVPRSSTARRDRKEGDR